MKGGALDPLKVQEARAEEMIYVKDLEVYQYASKRAAWEATGKAPIRVRWVDTDKGDRHRSRLCAQRRWQHYSRAVRHWKACGSW